VVLKHCVNLFFQIFKIVALNVLTLVSKILILARKCKVGHLDNFTADFSHVWPDWVFPEWTLEKWNILVAKVKRKFQFLPWLHPKSIRCYPCGQYRLKRRSAVCLIGKSCKRHPNWKIFFWSFEILIFFGRPKTKQVMAILSLKYK